MRSHQADFGRNSRDAARRLYRAAVQPDPLTQWGRILSEHLGSNSNLTLLGPAGRVIDMGGPGADDPDRLDYIERYQFINPLNPFWETAPQGQVIHFDQQLIDDECRRSEFFARYGHFLGLQDGVCMLLKVGGAHKMLVNVLLPRHARAAERSKALLADLSEDLRIALEIASAYLEASSKVASVIEGLGQEGVGVAILSDDGRVRDANHRMVALLQDDSSLHAELQGAVACPLAAQQLSNHGRRTVGRRGGYDGSDRAPRGRVAVYPVTQGAADPPAALSNIVVFVTDTADKRIDLTGHLRAEYGLTPAEGRVAERLRDGRTSRQIAAEFGVQPNCIRSHLKSIFAKTGTHSQVELLNFLQHENDLRLVGKAKPERRWKRRLDS